MRYERLIYSAAAAMLVAVIVSLLSVERFAAIVLAAFVHELGHLTCLRCLGLEISGVHLELSGMRIDYSGISSPLKDAAAALAGPVAGLLFFLAGLNSSGVLRLSAEFSLVYSLFNFLPIMPLDGGRVLHSFAELALDAPAAARFSDVLSLGAGIVIFVIGLSLMLKGEGGALFAAGIWLLLLQN